MNDLELKNLWRQQDAGAADVEADGDVVGAMKRRMRRFDRGLVWRDVRELAACAFIVWWFGGALWGHPSPLTRAGSVVLVGSALGISAVMLWARRADRKASRLAVSVEESLRAELRKVARQERLLTHVLWWYLLPIYVGTVLYVCGGAASAEWKWGFAVGYGALCGFLYWVNQYAARKQLRPLMVEIEQTLGNIACLEDATSELEREEG
jgi:hypothetical protein